MKFNELMRLILYGQRVSPRAEVHLGGIQLVDLDNRPIVWGPLTSFTMANGVMTFTASLWGPFKLNEHYVLLIGSDGSLISRSLPKPSVGIAHASNEWFYTYEVSDMVAIRDVTKPGLMG